jgi:hypothetical protein
MWRQECLDRLIRMKIIRCILMGKFLYIFEPYVINLCTLCEHILKIHFEKTGVRIGSICALLTSFKFSKASNFPKTSKSKNM